MLDGSWNFRWKWEICWEPYSSLFLLYANKKFDKFYPSAEDLREAEVNDNGQTNLGENFKEVQDSDCGMVIATLLLGRFVVIAWSKKKKIEETLR